MSVPSNTLNTDRNYLTTLESECPRISLVNINAQQEVNLNNYHTQPLFCRFDSNQPKSQWLGMNDWLCVEIVLTGSVRIGKMTANSSTLGGSVLYTLGQEGQKIVSSDYTSVGFFFHPEFYSYCIAPFMSKVGADSDQETAILISLHVDKQVYDEVKTLLVWRKSTELHAGIMIRQLSLHIVKQLLLANGHIANKLSFVPAKKSTVTKISYFLEANYTRNLTVQALASALGVSPSSFKRAFKKWSRLTPVQWLIDRRLDYAYFLVVYKKYSENTAAQMSGFGEITHFRKKFKHKFGFSTAKYHKHQKCPF